FGNLALRVVAIKNRRHVLAAVGAAAGIVRVPENVENLRVRNLLGIEIDLDRLSVVADVVIGRILCRAAAVADARANHSRKTPKLGVRSPESPERESRGLRFGRRGRIDGRN